MKPVRFTLPMAEGASGEAATFEIGIVPGWCEDLLRLEMIGLAAEVGPIEHDLAVYVKKHKLTKATRDENFGAREFAGKIGHARIVNDQRSAVICMRFAGSILAHNPDADGVEWTPINYDEPEAGIKARLKFLAHVDGRVRAKIIKWARDELVKRRKLSEKEAGNSDAPPSSE